MSSHYFLNDPELDSELFEIEEEIDGIKYRFYTANGVFSKRRVDLGSLILLNSLDLDNSGRLLDLGCGYGPIGIVIKKTNPKIDVEQVDINEKAVELTKINSTLNNTITKSYISDGFSSVEGLFDNIILNPPIRAGKKVVFNLYEEAYEHLNKGGNFWIVIRKQQGALSHKKYLESIFDKVEIIRRNKGYFVIKLEKLWKVWLFDIFNI